MQIEDIAVITQSIRILKPLVVAAQVLAHRTGNDFHLGRSVLEAQIRRFHRGHVIPDRFRRRTDIWLVPEFKIIHQPTKRLSRLSAKAVKRHEIRRESFQPVREFRCIIHHARHKKAILTQSTSIGKITSVCVDTRLRIRFLPTHAFTHVRNTRQTHKAQDDLRRIPLEPRTVERPTPAAPTESRIHPIYRANVRTRTLRRIDNNRKCGTIGRCHAIRMTVYPIIANRQWSNIQIWFTSKRIRSDHGPRPRLYSPRVAHVRTFHVKRHTLPNDKRASRRLRHNPNCAQHIRCRCGNRQYRTKSRQNHHFTPQSTTTAPNTFLIASR